jgi:hypothetical protein
LVPGLSGAAKGGYVLYVPRPSLIMLLSNYACAVARHGAQRLDCRCSGNVVTALLFTGTATAILALVAFVLLMMAGGDWSIGMLYVGMALGLAGASTQMAITRYRKHGHFEIDGERGVLRRYRGGRMTSEFKFNDVKRVWLAVDATDGMAMLGTMPTWLQIAFEGGQIFRIAKGSRQELEPVCEAMRELGLAPS